MEIRPFGLERYFAAHEFTARYLLSCSDCEALSLSELIGMADTETKRLWEELRLAYTESQGHALLRGAIAGDYVGLEASNVVVAAPEEAIFLLMHALLRAGDHVVAITPAYQSLYEVAESIGCSVDRWAPDEESGWRFDIASLEATLRLETRLVVVNFPHNPTGYVPSSEDFRAVAELARGQGAYLLSDEMYRFLEFEPASTLPAACELHENAISLSGLSKSFGLPGLRIGWLATRNAEIPQKVLALKDYTTICNSAPSEILAIIGLRNRARIIERQLVRLYRNLSILDGFFDEYDDCFGYNRPLGSSVCFPELRIAQDSSAFCDELLEKAGIMLVSSRLFDYGERHVRIGFGRDNLSEVIDVFATYLDANFR